ncbi:hypothetical protein OIE66_19710 [Nonomuraea sp. NBC_01738]|uniref:hypothetical protein n=1 Tax=Nonomuraea sp. NBC_01738 TaxID=2976003 RepID=UPI002E0FA45A|nr:hypothetical protein OIE66_19710 [Nonomuraea sp. NBC_01738]
MTVTPEALTQQQAADLLAGINDTIRAGEEMRALRTELVKVFADYGWTQDAIAHLTDMSQPAVSKHVARHRTDHTPPLDLTLDQPDTPWLEGRLWALAERLSETHPRTTRCTPHLHAIARGKRHFTPQTVDELRRLVEDDLRTHAADLPPAYRKTYDTISRTLDQPPNPSPQPPTTPTARRTLAYQVQLRHLP